MGRDRHMSGLLRDLQACSALHSGVAAVQLAWLRAGTLFLQQSFTLVGWHCQPWYNFSAAGIHDAAAAVVTCCVGQQLPADTAAHFPAAIPPLLFNYSWCSAANIIQARTAPNLACSFAGYCALPLSPAAASACLTCGAKERPLKS